MSITRQLIRGNNTSVEAATLLAAQYAFDTTKNEATVGTGSLAGGVRLAKKNNLEILVPAQLTASQNDYNPSGLKHAGVLAMSTSASWNVTGMVAAGAVDTVDGRTVILYNAGTFNLVVQDQNVASSAANRFDLGGADITLSPKQSITLRYRTQGALNRWEIAGGNFGQPISDGAVSARKLAASALGANAGMINGTIVETHTGNAVTFAIKTLAGVDPSATDPVLFAFRDPTAANGDYVQRSLTAALSFTISSGSSMGFSNATPGRLWLVAIDSGAGVVLGAINCLAGLDIFPLASFGLISSTAEGGAGNADLAATVYSAAAQTSKPYLVLGYASYETGVTTAGNWTASPTRLQLYGPGIALPGSVVQLASIRSTTLLATSSNQIPNDNTKPQITEGNAIFSKSLVASSAANILKISVGVQGEVLGATDYLLAALHLSPGPDTIEASVVYSAAVGGGGPVWIPIEHIRQAGVTTTQTFSVRAGSAAVNTVNFNGHNNGGILGGTTGSWMQIEELAA